MRISAHAKINWYLLVLNRRQDGYHDLQMLNQRIQLHDELDIQPADGLSLTVSGIANDELQSADNLVLRAASLLQQESGTSRGAAIHLKKRIPIRAGLGGGSADAAATLLLLNKLWALELPIERLQQIGLKLGADIPYCLINNPALVEGIGERLRPVYLGLPFHLVILLPRQELSTGEVFQRMQIAWHPMDMMRKDGALDALQRGDFGVMNMACVNHLQPAASRLAPEIPKLIHELHLNGAAFAQMTGAGSAVFGVYENKEKASAAHQKLVERHGKDRCLLTRTIS